MARAYDFWKRRLGVGQTVSWDGHLGTITAIPGPNVIRVTFDLPASKALGLSADIAAKYVTRQPAETHDDSLEARCTIVAHEEDGEPIFASERAGGNG